MNARHRRPRRFVALAVIATALLSLVTYTGPAAARTTYDCPALNGQPGYDSNGSGCLDPLWTTRAHGAYGELFGADVLLVGDSISTLCRSSITSRLDAQGLTWGVDYWSGRPTRAAVNRVLSLSVKPKVVFMEQGTNDIYNSAVMASEIQRLVDGLRPFGTRIMWQDVRAERPAYALPDMVNSRAINDQIWDNPNITPVPWMKWFDDQPNRKRLYIDSGGVHPVKPAGCEFMGATSTPTVIGAAKAAKLKASKPR